MDPRNEPPSSNGGDEPQRDYLGRILIGFISLAAFLWILVYIF
jgi:hypothetical protein